MAKSDGLIDRLSQHIPQKIIERNRSDISKVGDDIGIVVKNEADIKDDYEFSRENYRKLVEKGTDAIDHCMELALQSDHPRAYEVLGGMLKNVSDMTDKLMSLHDNLEKVKLVASKSKQKGDTSQNASITNNNVFVGSTTDLQRFIISQQENQKKVIIDQEESED